MAFKLSRHVTGALAEKLVLALVPDTELAHNHIANPGHYDMLWKDRKVEVKACKNRDRTSYGSVWVDPINHEKLVEDKGYYAIVLHDYEKVRILIVQANMTSIYFSNNTIKHRSWFKFTRFCSYTYDRTFIWPEIVYMLFKLDSEVM